MKNWHLIIFSIDTGKAPLQKLCWKYNIYHHIHGQFICLQFVGKDIRKCCIGFINNIFIFSCAEKLNRLEDKLHILNGYLSFWDKRKDDFNNMSLRNYVGQLVKLP